MKTALFFLNESSLYSAIVFGVKRRTKVTKVKIPTKPRIEASPPSSGGRAQPDLQEEEFDNVANMVIGSRDVVVSRALGQFRSNVSGTSVSFRSLTPHHSDDPDVATSHWEEKRQRSSSMLTSSKIQAFVPKKSQRRGEETRTEKSSRSWVKANSSRTPLHLVRKSHT